MISHSNGQVDLSVDDTLSVLDLWELHGLLLGRISSTSVWHCGTNRTCCISTVFVTFRTVGGCLCATNGACAALSKELWSASAPRQEFRWSCRWAATDEPPNTVWDIGACFVRLHALPRLLLALLFSPAVCPLFSVLPFRCGSALSRCGCPFQSLSRPYIAPFWTSIMHRVVLDLDHCLFLLLVSGSSSLPARSLVLLRAA